MVLLLFFVNTPFVESNPCGPCSSCSSETPFEITMVDASGFLIGSTGSSPAPGAAAAAAGVPVSELDFDLAQPQRLARLQHRFLGHLLRR